MSECSTNQSLRLTHGSAFGLNPRCHLMEDNPTRCLSQVHLPVSQVEIADGIVDNTVWQAPCRKERNTTNTPHCTISCVAPVGGGGPSPSGPVRQHRSLRTNGPHLDLNVLHPSGSPSRPPSGSEWILSSDSAVFPARTRQSFQTPEARPSERLGISDLPVRAEPNRVTGIREERTPSSTRN